MNKELLSKREIERHITDFAMAKMQDSVGAFQYKDIYQSSLVTLMQKAANCKQPEEQQKIIQEIKTIIFENMGNVFKKVG
jgi:hypothetical protein